MNLEERNDVTVIILSVNVLFSSLIGFFENVLPEFLAIMSHLEFGYILTRKLSGQLVDPSRPGDFNQALMEFGATLCTPLSPSCSACPVSAHCHALSLATKQRSAQVTDYPIKVVKSKQRHDFAAVTVVEILEGQDAIEELQPDGRFLLVKRPEEGLLAGLWEFPSVLVEVEADLATRRHSIDQFLKKSFMLDLKKSCSVVLREDIGEYVHVFSHIRLKMFVELLVIRLKGLVLLSPLPLSHICTRAHACGKHHMHANTMHMLLMRAHTDTHELVSDTSLNFFASAGMKARGIFCTENLTAKLCHGSLWIARPFQAWD